MPDRLENYIEKLTERHKVDSADLDVNRQGHFVLDIVEEADSIEIVIVTSSEAGVPPLIWSRPRGGERQSWPTTALRKIGHCALYSVTLEKASIPVSSRFFLRDNRTWTRILNPYDSKLDLPEGWAFSPNHLYLTYLAPPEPEVQLPRHRAFARTVANQSGKLVVAGVIIANYPLSDVEFVIRKFRDEGVNWRFPVEIRTAARVWGMSARAYRAYRGETAYKFVATCDLPWETMTSSIYGAAVETEQHKSGLYPFNQNIFVKNGLLQFAKRALFSYIDVVASNIRLELFSFPKSFIAETVGNISVVDKDPPLCLVGEYTNSARDNGLRLFEAMRADKSVDPWYVIEDDCGFSGKRVLSFGSKQHFVKSLQASAVAFSHHPNYVLPELANYFRKRPAKMVFLQHGVTALKNSMPSYHSSKRAFDGFVVSSESEGKAIAQACNYADKNMVITGMPRLDRLFRLARGNVAERRDIVVFPTWRRGLDKVDTTEFLSSDFYIAWSGAMAALREAGGRVGKRLVLISHPIIERHIEAFSSMVDDIVDVETLQETLINAACLVTDYSSVAFDAIYVDVPAIFFTFDDVEYRFAEGAFIDVDNELPGIRYRSLDEFKTGVEDFEACLALARSASSGIRHKYFRHVDDNNSKRVISTIRKLVRG